MNDDQYIFTKGDLLVVDDTLNNLRLLSDLLTEQGYKVRSVLNGMSAIRACQAKPPDLILLDINMPEMNGYEVCEKLKAMEETHQIPVIFLSALHETLDQVKAFKIGGADYITKPFQIEEVLIRIENQLKLRNNQKLLAQQNLLLEEKNIILKQEIYERQLIQTALELSEAKNFSLLSAIPDLMFRISAAGIFLDYRPAKEPDYILTNDTILDEQIVGKNVFEIFSNDLALWTMYYVEQTLDTQEIQIGEYIQKIEGKWYSYEARYVKSGSQEVLAIVRNISERKKSEAARLQSEALLTIQTQRLEQALSELKQAQAQLVQNEKMVSLGQLVAGIAHEINNPVTFIYGNFTFAIQYVQELFNLINLYQNEYPNPSPIIQQKIVEIDLNFLISDLYNIMSSMQMGANRIRQIVLSLRNFSRLDEADTKLVDIHEGIDSTLLILQHRLGKKDARPAIEIVKNYANIPPINCYPSQLNQVFFNILNNAVDALDRGNSDRSQNSQSIPMIGITTEMVTVDRIRIRIRDNGPGIAEINRSRLFDPFFTTKPVGQGTGLGLWTSYQIIVEKHQGQLTCRSSPGQGAEFVIEIPLF